MLAPEGEVGMGQTQQEAGGERRRAMRVPVRGHVVFHAALGPIPATLENLSRGGALVRIGSTPEAAELELELRLVDGSGSVRARTVRVEPAPDGGVRLAVEFERVAPTMRAVIEASISSALAAARRRPILVIDDQQPRRSRLIAALAKAGLTPFAPQTPLEAIELLTRAQLQVSACLLGSGFGVPTAELAAMLSESFPWVTTTEITDDLRSTLDRVIETWAQPPVARVDAAIG